MLQLKVAFGQETYDEVLNEFGHLGTYDLELEHSLASLSKWESEFKKPFLSNDPKTTGETFSYIKSMILTPNVPQEVFEGLSDENLLSINNYINDPMTATWFTETSKEPSGRPVVVTAEIIYYWMVALAIPFECQYWHLNRLFTLIKVINLKNSPPSKANRTSRDRQEMNAARLAENARRKAALGTTG